jgi:hypothetical protein
MDGLLIYDMAHKKAGNLQTPVQFPSLVGMSDPDQLMSAFLAAPTIGVAVLDRCFRFEAINEALAKMNGIPAQDHLGKPLHNILGDLAEEVGTAFETVFVTGKPMIKELNGVLPSRMYAAHWIESYFPIKGAAGSVNQVGAIVIEVPDKTGLTSADDSLAGRSSDASGNLNHLDLSTHLEKSVSLRPSKYVNEVVRSWKEIAHYAATSVRTVQRWEKEFGLPVRRTKAAKGAVVFAFDADLNRWLHDRPTRK